MAISDSIAARPVETDILPRISVELTNICNLHCSYCVRDEDALYHTPASFLSADLLRRIVRSAREVYPLAYVSFTGGEVTIHPKFAEIIEAVVGEGLQFTFVTNAWHFERVYPLLVRNRAALRAVGISLDGATREAHDRWRGEGSFVRVMRAISRCYASGIPFILKVGLRRDTVPQLQEIALLGARLGAKALHFSHFLPTSSASADESALTLAERAEAEEEIGILTKILKMPIGLVTGYYNLDPEAPCSPLKGTNCNIDYRGRLTLCCNLSGFRGAEGEPDVVADLNREDFASAYPRLRRLVEEQNERRRRALAAHRDSGREVDLYTGSPCLFCLQSFGKIPWHGLTGERAARRSLPVLNSTDAALQKSEPVRQHI
ncbi:MAG TPA: radical SAM protein [Pyrinomonadaceae bacterium]|jgi:MoaA/NifB/PqqE/SkfB family radical SAM enzyme